MRRRGAEPPRPARVAPGVWPRLRRFGVWIHTPRLRRPSRPGLSALTRAHARPGAVGVEPRLVDGVPRDAVLSARLLLCRPAPALALSRRALPPSDLPGPAVADVAGSRRHRVRPAPARRRQWLVGASWLPGRAHTLDGGGQRSGRRRSHRDAARAARMGTVAPARARSHPLGRRRGIAALGPRAHLSGGDRRDSPRARAGGGGARSRDGPLGSRIARASAARSRRPSGRRSSAHVVLVPAAAPAARAPASARVGPGDDRRRRLAAGASSVAAADRAAGASARRGSPTTRQNSPALALGDSPRRG